MRHLKSGFTLIELLIVIVIMGILVGLVTTNLVGGRERAQDNSKKRHLEQLKVALHLYYTDFGHYPPSGNGATFPACGDSGNVICSSSFIAGGKEYMGKLPKNNQDQNDFSYYSCNNQDDFRLVTTLNNASDSDLPESQARCPSDLCEGQTLVYSETSYVLCGN